jgi:hypothetical protein
MTKKVEREYFYLKGSEPLGDVISLIRKTKSKELVLVVPADSPLFTHPVHIELLAEELKKLKKDIFISTDDLRIIDLCRHYGIPLFLEEYKNLPPAETIVKDIEVETKEKPLKKRKKIFKFSFKILKPVALFVFIFIIGIALFSFLKTNVELNLSLAREKISISEVIQTDDDALRVDVDKLLVPAKIVDLEVNHTVSIETTGQKTLGDTRPRGLIEIQNNNTSPIPLVAGTRFTYSDKVYRSKEKVIVPAKSQDGEPGKIVVEVLGDKDYDDVIEPGTTFLIPGLQGTLWEPLVKAVAKTEIKKSSGEVRVVTLEDINNLRLQLEKELKSKLEDLVKKNYPDSYYTMQGGIFTSDLLNISHKVGEATDRISATGRARIQTVAIKKEDLTTLIKGLVLEKSLDKKIEEINVKSIEILDLNLAKNTSVVDVKGEVTMMPIVNTNELKDKLKGQDIQKVREILANDGRFAKIQVKIFPSWRNSFPKDPERIKINIE